MDGHVMGFYQLVQKLGHSKRKQAVNTKQFYSSRDTKAGAYVGVGVRTPPPPPTWKKSSTQKCPKEERKFRSDKSAKKNVHVPLRYDKIKTKKVGKKEDISKRKGIKLKK